MGSVLKMPTKSKRFDYLRKQYTVFIYEAHHWKIKGQKMYLEFSFQVGKITFNPKSNIKFPKGINLDRLSKKQKDLIENLVFQIGMVEMISYWKATCSPEILIQAYKLGAAQQRWWKKLFYNGLGEFLYLNKIKTNENDLVKFRFDGGNGLAAANEKLALIEGIKSNAKGVIIPIGGGKDSLATVEVLKKHRGKKYFLLMNPTRAAKDSIKLAADKLTEQKIIIERKIDRRLLDLNAKGYLNGHTPFSAMLAFYCSLSAVVTGAKYSVLSNESSANEPTILGTNINHQYSKSYEFEKDFNRYLDKYVSKDVEYLSLLRPLNELQIVGIFSSNQKNFKIFKSCNVGSKKDEWCCNCSKCLFVFILLSARIGIEKCTKIFGENLFENKSLRKTFVELIGRSKTKPFECIGTIDEVNVALTMLHQQEASAFEQMDLLRYYKKRHSDAFADKREIRNIRNQFDKKHRIPQNLLALLKEAHAKAN